MAIIVLADDGITFDGYTLEERPLGGAETAFVSLAEALAGRGHRVQVVNRCGASHHVRGVAWSPIEDGFPDRADLYIANRGDRLLTAMPRARRRAFWIHNPAGYLLKWRYLAKLMRLRPTIVFSGAHHLSTYPRWAPGGPRVVIPYGIEDRFRSGNPARTPPAPRAVFTSNPLRGLDWLLTLWAERVHPQLPDARLHVFSGPGTYGMAGMRKAGPMAAVISRAQALGDAGVVLRGPVPKEQLVDELRAARVMPYRGDVGETFCLALGEAQAMGVPCVVQPIGCVAERVRHGQTGYVEADEDAFVARLVELLRDDGVWTRQHDAALAAQRQWGWGDAAAAFEELLG